MKIFNKEGNKAYIALVQEMLTSSNYPANYEKKYKNLFKKIITSEKYLELLENSKDLKEIDFENRFEFGKYLFDLLKNCSFSKVNRNENLWNYITCFHLKNLISNSRKENRLLYMPKFFDLKRNLVRTSWLLYYLLKEHSLFTLCSKLNEHSNMCEQFVSRQEMLRNSSIGELCMRMYYNPKTKKLKQNAAKHEKDKKIDGWLPGVIYPRLTKTVGKLYKIYDLWTINVDDLEKLVGKEFSVWGEVE